jgi:drug/metabolite transporter (DMT)-like permease
MDGPNFATQGSQAEFGRTDLWMLVAVILWAVNFSLIKIALREFSILAFNGIRLSFASLVLLLFLLLKGEGFHVQRRDLIKLFLMGLLGNTFYQLVFMFGFDMTTASNSAIIIAVTPAIIALLSALLKHESVHWAAWLGIAVSFAGLYLVVTNQLGTVELNRIRMKGDLLIFLGVLFWAVYTVAAKPLLERISPLKLTAFSMGLGTLAYLPFCVKSILAEDYTRISAGAWGSLLFSGFFALAVCYVIWYMSVKKVGNSRTAIYDNLIPVMTVFFAWLFLGERLSLLQGVGAAVIFLGVYLARKGYLWFTRFPLFFSGRPR